MSAQKNESRRTGRSRTARRVAFVVALACMEYVLTGCIGGGMCPNKNNNPPQNNAVPPRINAAPGAPGGAPGVLAGQPGQGGLLTALPGLVKGLSGLAGGGGGGAENTTPFAPGQPQTAVTAPQLASQGTLPAGGLDPATALALQQAALGSGSTIPLVALPTPAGGLTSGVPLVPAATAATGSAGATAGANTGASQGATPTTSAPAAEVTIKDKNGNDVPVVKVKTSKDSQGNTVIDETTAAGQTIEIKQASAGQGAATTSAP